jgi:CDP-diacylglycerol--serine O-phosphatidyltransferase
VSEHSKLENGYLSVADASRIYFLPNLMTAGNLFCGFLAVIRCIQAKYVSTGSEEHEAIAQAWYTEAVWLILMAVIFDVLDGRLARLGGKESLFGKEFDSIADIVSFGMAPSLMVFFLILSPTDAYPIFRQVGWVIGFIYLLCAAVRLARFNVITHPSVMSEDSYSTKDFVGLPVPAAAGMIASLVLVINRFDLKHWAIFLPILLLMIAFLMVSNVHYPGFKKIDWHTQTKLRTFIFFLVCLTMIFLFRSVAIAVCFLGYIFFGILRQYRRDRFATRRGGEFGEEDPLENLITRGSFSSARTPETDRTTEE